MTLLNSFAPYFELIRSTFRNRRTNPNSLLSQEYQDKFKLLTCSDIPSTETIGVIAGNGPFPFLFSQGAKALGHNVFAVCHENETSIEYPDTIENSIWIKVGQLGSIIDFFKKNKVKYVAMAGGISRVKHFGDVKLDARGAALMLRLRSTKDDVIMRGIADELLKEGIVVIPCTLFMQQAITPIGNLTKSIPTVDERNDIEVGISAIKSMSSQDIGQLVVVREGTIVAVEAIEGTNSAIIRGGELGGKGSVVVKFAKPTQDMRFDVPTVGLKTIELLKQHKISVLALEAGRTIIIEREKCIEMANDAGIAIVGIEPLVNEILG